MKIIGLLGLIALLGAAFLISNNRFKIRPRVMIWGLSLQFVFAMIVLREDYVSFIGMGILVLLLIVYLLQNDALKIGKVWLSWSVLIGGSVLSAALLYVIPFASYTFLGITSLILVFNAVFKWKRVLQRYAAGIFLLSVFVVLFSNDLYGRLIFQVFSDKVSEFLALSDYGARFLFGNLVESEYFFTEKDSVWPGFGFQFAFKILPTIIFFSAFISSLY
jgi:CNT family concentrative nucleoside transporter